MAHTMQICRISFGEEDFTDIHVCMHAYIHAFIHAYIHTSYIHTCMHACIHTYALMPGGVDGWAVVGSVVATNSADPLAGTAGDMGCERRGKGGGLLDQRWVDLPSGPEGAARARTASPVSVSSVGSEGSIEGELTALWQGVAGGPREAISASPGSTAAVTRLPGGV